MDACDWTHVPAIGGAQYFLSCSAEVARQRSRSHPTLFTRFLSCYALHANMVNYVPLIGINCIHLIATRNQPVSSIDCRV